jgi:hypothetical protein
LDTVTYPEASVAAAISTHCVPLQVNTQAGSGAAVVERYRQVWTPDVRVLAADGFELYRWNGYLPPFEFLPQLLVALGQARLRLHDEARAAALYEEVLSRFPTSAVAPEAQYYLGVARYKDSHEGADLAKAWHHLQMRYPESIWRTKQSFIER